MLFSADSILQGPQTSLCVLYILYKGLLDIVAFSAPGDGFDSSTLLSGWPEGGPLSKLVRWDAIWFAGQAQLGHVFEHGHAFSYVYATLLSWSRLLWADSTLDGTIYREATFGIFISHISHLLGVLVLFRLSLIVFRWASDGKQIAFIASCAHIISPAGVFLSAPYAEAPFSLLQFTAYWAYASSQVDIRAGKHVLHDAKILLTGALLGASCTLRSNGLLSGTILLLDAIQYGLPFLHGTGDWMLFRKGSATVFAGILIACGQAVTQIIGWRIFCTEQNPFDKRPFCHDIPPSIYNYVQGEYWDNGFLRYWQAKNIPLFLLCSPTIFVMLLSSWWALSQYLGRQPQPNLAPRQCDRSLMIRFAIPQALIALVCLFVGNVQIITRLSSGYPTWYWWLALQIVEYASERKTTRTWSNWLPMFYSRWAIIYGVVQCGLYAAFLPPA